MYCFNMPKQIIITLDKSVKDSESLGDRNIKGATVSLTLPIQIEFEIDEYDILHSYIKNNKNFNSIKLKIPGGINLRSVLTEDIIKDNIPNLLITIKEKEEKFTSSVGEYI